MNRDYSYSVVFDLFYFITIFSLNEKSHVKWRHFFQIQDMTPISSYDTAGSFLLLGCQNGSIYYIGKCHTMEHIFNYLHLISAIFCYLSIYQMQKFNLSFHDQYLHHIVICSGLANHDQYPGLANHYQYPIMVPLLYWSSGFS